jgi:mRNA interferase MazF
MAITFHPEPRMVLMCNFDSGFKPPEMVKVRPVIILSPRRHNRETCIVVPLSSTRPDPIEVYHHMLDPLSLPKRLRDANTWVKGNMVTTIAVHRLDRVRDGLDSRGQRRFVTHYVTYVDWSAVQQTVFGALGFSSGDRG